jgi:Fe2+ or Zn2+ uptake regulation protein
MKHSSVCQTKNQNPATFFESAVDLLKASGLKLTTPRQTLLKMMQKLEAPFSTDEVFRAINRPTRGTTAGTGSNKFDLVTVYRNLSAFTDAGLLARVELDDGVQRYEWADPSGHHHHHFVCTSCRRIEPLDLCSVDGPIQTQESLMKRKGYSQITHRLEFYGLCPQCSKSS